MQSVTPQLIPIADAAKSLGICERTIWTHISKGALPVVRLSPRMIRIDVVDLREFVSARREVRKQQSPIITPPDR